MPADPAAPGLPPPLDRERVRGLVADAVRRALGAEEGSSAAGARAETGAVGRWVPWAPTARERESAAAGPPLPRAEGGRPDRPVVAVGADHGAVTLKDQLVRYLREELGHPVLDCGTHSADPVDYPDLARAVGRAVAEGAAWRGIVLDTMGIGSSMAANKVWGVRCALCHDEASAKNAREHNDANVLALGSRVVNPGSARALVRIFLATPHAGGRHARRVAKINAIEHQQAALAARGRE